MRHRRPTRTSRTSATTPLRRWRSTPLLASAAVGVALVLPSVVIGASTATTAANVTIVAQNLAGEPISEFTFLISEDNAARRTDPPAERPGRRPTPSYIPLVAAGDEGSATVSLNPGRYLVTVKAPDHKLWGEHFTVAAADQQVVVQLKHHPQPLGKLVVHAFEDRQPVNAAPDFGDAPGADPEPALAGFEVRLHDTIGEMQADYNGDPLCGGQCLTGPDGNVTIPNLAPGRYEIEVLPPDGTDWLQTTTFEGTHLYDFARVTENDDGLGAIGEAAVAAGIPTAWWFGFVQPKELPAGPAGRVSGTARTWVGWPPYNKVVLGSPVKQAVVALSGAADQQVYTGFADPETGEFTIENIPDGTYRLSIFDVNLDWIIHYVTFTLPDANGSRDLDLNLDDDVTPGERGIPVARWFGWVSGHVFEDNGLDANGDPIPGASADDGIRTCVPAPPLIEGRCEEGIDGMDLDLRWRDGSVKTGTFSGPNQDPASDAESGYYEYPELLSPLSRFLISEVGFPRLARTGASLHDEFDPTQVTPLPDGLGGGLLLNQMTAEGHRSWVDWGKREYEPGEHGGITGIVFYATTRNELDPRFAGAEDYEPGIPDATVNLYEANCADPSDPLSCTLGELVSTVQADAWSHPRSDHPDEPQSCEARDATGAALPPFTPNIAANCIEFPTLSNQTKDGAFDGGYAIEETDEGDPLVPGDYIVEVVPPPFYQVVKEEDQNTAEGDEVVPQIETPYCVGPMHKVPADSGHPDAETDKPLCNRKLVTLEDGQNPAADFFLFTDVDDDPDTNTAELGSWNTAESVAPPGRIFGLVADDLRFDVDPTSPWYGQPMALPNIPVGVYDYTGRLITMLHTDEFGFYDVTLPSTQTYNCPTPSGVCPGMYVLRIDDPADPAFNPDFLTAVLAFDVWPGKTTFADTPVDPISAIACTLGPFTEGQGQQPEFLRVSNPYILRNASTANQAQRELTIDGVGFAASRGTGVVRLGNSDLPASAYLAWSDRQIRVRVPLNFGQPGPQQLLIRGANGVWTPLGITIHSRQSSSYFPPIVEVGPGQSIQDAIDGAALESLIVVRPGVHVENVILRKRVRLQGVGPGGTIGALETTVPDDLRFTITGSVINARNFFDRQAAWEAELASQSFVGNQAVPGGAGITVVAPTQSHYHTTSNIDRRRASIDGFGITLGQSIAGGAGGIQVNSWAQNLWITNNILENNGGGIGGGIALGTPANFPGRTGGADNENDKVRIAYNRILGNGALTNGGGVAIYNGAERYAVERNQICSNYSVTYGAGVGHLGRSPKGTIHDNHLYGNEAFDSGGGVAVSGDAPVANGGAGTGDVDVRRNYIWFNLSNDDGGGMFVRDTKTSEIWLVANVIANNVATDFGGGVALDDVPGARIINNTVVRNASTDTAEDRDGIANGAGLVSEPNDSGTGFSNPVEFRNNIFWQNEAFTYDPTGGQGGEPALISAGPFDLEVIGPGVFSPITSLLTALDPANFANPASAQNQIGVDPQFVAEYINEIDVGPSRFGPAGEIQTTLFRNDPPPPFKEGAPGDYHLTAGSPLATRVGGSAGTVNGYLLAPRCDIDRQLLPSASGVATVAPRGADLISTNPPADICPS